MAYYVQNQEINISMITRSEKITLTKEVESLLKKLKARNKIVSSKKNSNDIEVQSEEMIRNLWKIVEKTLG